MTPKEIKKLRRKLGLSQAELARKLGIRRANVNYWERGKHTPSPTSVRLIQELERRMPDHWSDLAGYFILESCGDDWVGKFVRPAKWTKAQYDELVAAIRPDDWDESEDGEFVPIHREVMAFLGRRLQGKS